MSIHPSWWSRFKGALGELGQTFSGTDVEQALDLEIRAVDQDLKAATAARDTARAERFTARQHVQRLRAEKGALEESTLQLLAARRKAAARQKAQEVAVSAADLAEWETRERRTLELLRERDALVDQLDRRLRRLRYQLGTFRASANLQRTQDALVRAQKGARTLPETAFESVRRLREALPSRPVATPAAVLPPSDVESADRVLARLEPLAKGRARAKARKTSQPSSRSRKPT